MTLQPSIKNGLTLSHHERTSRDIWEGYADYNDDRDAVCLKGDNGSNQPQSLVLLKSGALTEI